MASMAGLGVHIGQLAQTSPMLEVRLPEHRKACFAAGQTILQNKSHSQPTRRKRRHSTVQPTAMTPSASG